MPRQDEANEPRSLRNETCQTDADRAALKALKEVASNIMADEEMQIIIKSLYFAVKLAVIADRGQPEFYSINQLAIRYGISRTVIEKWNIPRHKFGGSYRYSLEVVQKFEEECRENPEKPL